MFEDITIRTLMRTARTQTMLIARSIDTTDAHFQTELDLLELLQLTQIVVSDRLASPAVAGIDPKTFMRTILVEAGHYEERKKDAKNGYKLLFDSIRKDVIETIRTTFVCSDGRARGSVIQKYNTIALDAIFTLLTMAGPERAASLLITLVKAVERDIMGLEEIDEMDSLIASNTLTNLAKKRARRNMKPLTKAHRLILIEEAVQQLQV